MGFEDEAEQSIGRHCRLQTQRTVISADAELSRAVSRELIDLNQASCRLYFVSFCVAGHS